MTKGLLMPLDAETQLVDLGADDGVVAHEIIGDYFDVTMLTMHHDPHKISLGIIVDDRGLIKELPINVLATRVRGMFKMQDTPLVGPAILIASNWEGEGVDLPESVIALVKAMEHVQGESEL